MKALRIFLLLLLCICGQIIFVQTADAQAIDLKKQKEVVENRKKMSKLTRKQVESNVWKESKSIAKQMKKDGWKPMPGTPPLRTQQNDMLMRRYELDGNFPRYIIGSGQAVSTVAGMARKHAIARARVDLASNIGAEVSSLTSDATTNIEYSLEEQEAVGKLVDESMTKVQQSIGNTEVVFEAYREIDGKTEVLVYISYDGVRAKSDILKMFDKDHKELREKLEKMMEEQ